MSIVEIVVRWDDTEARTLIPVKPYPFYPPYQSGFARDQREHVIETLTRRAGELISDVVNVVTER